MDTNTDDTKQTEKGQETPEPLQSDVGRPERPEETAGGFTGEGATVEDTKVTA